MIRLPLLVCVLAALAGCNTWQPRAEFAAPQSRWPATLPSPVARNAPAPPVPVSYCYRTLASVDCYAQPQPERAAAFTGRYPTPNSGP
jgi:hypothetical protein